MSGKNNVNPDHYKIAGRDRPNEVLAGEPRVPSAGGYGAPAKGRAAPNFIPGALPVGQAPPPRRRTAAAKPARRASGGSRSTKTRATRAARGTAPARKRQGAARGKPRAARKRS